MALELDDTCEACGVAPREMERLRELKQRGGDRGGERPGLSPAERDEIITLSARARLWTECVEHPHHVFDPEAVTPEAVAEAVEAGGAASPGQQAMMAKLGLEGDLNLPFYISDVDGRLEWVADHPGTPRFSGDRSDRTAIALLRRYLDHGIFDLANLLERIADPRLDIPRPEDRSPIFVASRWLHENDPDLWEHVALARKRAQDAAEAPPAAPAPNPDDLDDVRQTLREAAEAERTEDALNRMETALQQMLEAGDRAASAPPLQAPADALSIIIQAGARAAAAPPLQPAPAPPKTRKRRKRR
jgi:hypothetical protein